MMKGTSFAITAIVCLFVSTASADDYRSKSNRYWHGNHVAGRSYCSHAEILSFQKTGGTRTIGSLAARERVTFGWNGDLVVEFLSIGVNFSLEPVNAPIITFIDDAERDTRMGTYSQEGNRVDVLLEGADSIDLSANWYASRDGSTLHGSATRRIEIEESDITIGQTISWTLVEGDHCVADAFPEQL